MPVILVMLLAASPARVASVGFSGGLERSLLSVLEERAVQRLASDTGLPVLTQKDVASALGLERQRQLLGCGDDSGCLTELAGALGATMLLTGDATLVGKRYSVTLKLLDASSGRTLFAAESRVDGEDGLVSAVQALADQAAEVVRPPEPKRWLPAVAVGLGVASSGAGLAFALKANFELSELRSLSAQTGSRPGQQLLDRGASLRTDGQRDVVLSTSLFCAGAALAVGGLVWWLLLPDAPVAVALVPAHDGTWVSLVGRWP